MNFVAQRNYTRAIAVGRATMDVGIVPLLLLIVVAAMALVEPHFYSTGNILNMVRSASFLAVVACGQALVLIAGGFDLSVGAVIALASVLAAKTMAWIGVVYPDEPGLAIAAGVLAALLSGAGVGLLNGLCVAKLRISGFVATIGTMSVTLGIALILTNGIPVYGLPGSFVQQFGRATWLGLPSTIYAALSAIALLVFVQRRTLLGRYIHAIGGNPEAAIVSGVSVFRYQTSTYVLSGVFAALTGVLLTAHVGSGQASLGGDRMMLQSIAAAVIGGVSLRGGVGRLEIVTLASLFLTVLTNALNLLRIDSRLQPVLLGVILVVAVALDELSRRNSALDRHEPT
jgi:ribose transport system permease protein